jgi:hypothetical protein
MRKARAAARYSETRRNSCIFPVAFEKGAGNCSPMSNRLTSRVALDSSQIPFELAGATVTVVGAGGMLPTLDGSGNEKTPEMVVTIWDAPGS